MRATLPPVSFESKRARAQVQGILDFLAVPGMAALYDGRGNVVAKAGEALRQPKGLRVVNIGQGYRLCIQRASTCLVRDRVERGTQLLRRLLTGESDSAQV